MLANIVGYNRVEYNKNGKSGSFMTVYVTTDKEVDFGSEYLAVNCSESYWNDKINPAFLVGGELHVGFDRQKDNKPFLYVKK